MAEDVDRTLALSTSCLEQARKDVRGPWLRAAPLVLRQGLEELVSRSVTPHGVDQNASMRAKLLCFAELSGPEPGAEAVWLWERLSAGCHFGVYELELTIDDLSEWRDRIEALAGLECSSAESTPNLAG